MSLTKPDPAMDRAYNHFLKERHKEMAEPWTTLERSSNGDYNAHINKNRAVIQFTPVGVLDEEKLIAKLDGRTVTHDEFMEAVKECTSEK